MSDQASPAPQDAGTLSLLSLSIAAANATPVDVPRISETSSGGHGGADDAARNASFGGHSVDSNASHGASTGASVHNALKHRRLSSIGQSKRRLSDARDAASRPSPAGLQAAAAALSALASLSLSSTPPQSISLAAHGSTATSYVPASSALSAPVPIPTLASNRSQGGAAARSHPAQDGADLSSSLPLSFEENEDGKNAGVTVKNGKKRGTIFTCESCSKVYRHPSCLIKHRWEHSPHWREASKFLLSKHQQVQLMEAAAILSHMSPTATGGTSLPDDRSLWPSFLSGGALPPPSTSGPATKAISKRDNSSSGSGSYPGPTHPMSSSVPTHPTPMGPSSRAGSAGPRLHDYPIPTASVGAASVTHLRPGVLAVPTGPSSFTKAGSPSPFAFSRSHSSGVMSPYAHELESEAHAFGDESHRFGSVEISTDAPMPASFASVSVQSYTRSEGTGAWSSSFSASSTRSDSDSLPRSNESEFVEVEVSMDDSDFVDLGHPGGFSSRGRTSMTRSGFSVKEEEEEEEEEWDGMEMEMEL
ncbi:hypothetical protein EVG20_g8878 [Dentipellis fragilis]|uniref:C2H2-type domain-containing protein n=1 Tax=Dentipellis fragilis TaxID=205917 RepID=A0A4Y9Y460_9AGAM|nr:hypothetical protein EVG20_g8878 [Dentipellis fragilis]